MNSTIKKGTLTYSIFTLVLGILICSEARSQIPTSLLHPWQFSATCDTPSTSLDGTINIVFDSGSIVVGGIHLGKKVLPFHGRHFGDRFIARTDPKHYPVIRLDLNLDSLPRSITGVMQVSKIEAKEPRKRARTYYNVFYQLYAVRE